MERRVDPAGDFGQPDDGIVPAPRRAIARLEFIRAVATHTKAITELAKLYSLRKRQPSARDRMLRNVLTTSHPFFVLPMRFTPETLTLLAGRVRVSEATAWANRWNLAIPWLQAWATFALVLWDVARSCADPQCPFDCAKTRDDEAFALEHALSLPAMLLIGEPPLIVSILQGMQSNAVSRHAAELDTPAEAGDPMSDYLPIHMRRVSPPLPGPHPLLETRPQFTQRAAAAWDGAIASLEKQGVSLKAPRKLREHSEWLVRHHVLDETAASIVERLDNTDPSTVYKAVKALAQTIGLPIRALPETPTA